VYNLVSSWHCGTDFHAEKNNPCIVLLKICLENCNLFGLVISARLHLMLKVFDKPFIHVGIKM